MKQYATQANIILDFHTIWEETVCDTKSPVTGYDGNHHRGNRL